MPADLAALVEDVGRRDRGPAGDPRSAADAELAAADARARLDDRRPGQSPCLLRRGRRHVGDRSRRRSPPSWLGSRQRRREPGHDRGAASAARPRPSCATGSAALATELLSVFAGLDPATRVPWFGPPMSVASSLTARLMETWAHGQDIADTVGAQPRADAPAPACSAHRRRRPRVQLHRARPARPAEPVRVELVAPSGELWTWGPAEAADRVTGPALDFCLLVTQRRHRADTAVTARGPVAQQWLTIAQAFAGPPGAGRAPGQFDRGGRGAEPLRSANLRAVDLTWESM